MLLIMVKSWDAYEEAYQDLQDELENRKDWGDDE
jgi:hypothetical protein